MEKNSMIYLHSMPHMDEKSYMCVQASVRGGLHLLYMHNINVQNGNYFTQGKFLIALLLHVY